MSASDDTLLAFVKGLQQEDPAYLNLRTAQTDDEFEKAFDQFLENAMSDLEKRKREFADLDENGLSSALALRLSMPGILAQREVSSNGHVDLTISVGAPKPSRTKLGEAKIYHGPQYHMDGLGQLLKRYTTGRESRGLLITYVRQKGISDLMKKLRDRLDEDRPCAQCENTTDHSIRWSFLSKHKHSSGDPLDVAHIGCNLFIDDDH